LRSVIRLVVRERNSLRASCENCTGAKPATEWLPCASAEVWARRES